MRSTLRLGMFSKTRIHNTRVYIYHVQLRQLWRECRKMQEINASVFFRVLYNSVIMNDFLWWAGIFFDYVACHVTRL